MPGADPTVSDDFAAGYTWVASLNLGTAIADDFASASVLFADVVDLTPMSARMTPAELVGLLDGIFTAFDGFVAEPGLEKIKTVGGSPSGSASTRDQSRRGSSERTSSRTTSGVTR
jgi:hypothetical protein